MRVWTTGFKKKRGLKSHNKGQVKRSWWQAVEKQRPCGSFHRALKPCWLGCYGNWARNRKYFWREGLARRKEWVRNTGIWNYRDESKPQVVFGDPSIRAERDAQVGGQGDGDAEKQPWGEGLQVGRAHTARKSRIGTERGQLHAGRAAGTRKGQKAVRSSSK